jgi:hypothetical protein
VPVEETASLVSLIVQTCLENETVLGTNLGNAIKVKFPDLNLKLQFGGLRKFIQDYCADQVVYVRAQGGDGVYAHVSKAAGAAPTPTSTAWAALVDPNVHSQLAVDRASGTLQIYGSGAVIPEALIRLDKISPEEHRTIAKEFLPLIPTASRSLFESALNEEPFWLKWTAAFRNLADRELSVSWMKWRYEKIVALFEGRLRSASLSDDAVAFCNRRTPEVKTGEIGIN